MFGYVKPFKPQMKICEFEAYKAVYCGLCGKLGESFGPLARLTLSYDFTFLSILHLSLSGDEPKIKACRRFNPFCRKLRLKNEESLSFGADVAVIMLYYKLLDNISDSRFPVKSGWQILKPFVSHARKKAITRVLKADSIIENSIARQAKIESAKTTSLDEASEATACAMSEICLLLPGGDKQGRILARFGYLLGRYVYISDALDDIETDIKQGAYNPLIGRFGSDASGVSAAYEYARESLYMTIGEAIKAYDLLELESFRPVLDNIVYLGLRASVDEIIARKTKQLKTGGV